jgi:uncharacterized membrane protein
MERTSNRTFWIGLGLLALLALFALPTWGGAMFIGRGFAGPFGVHPLLGVGMPWLVGFGLFALLIKLAIWAAIIFFVIRMFRGFSGRPFGAMPRRDLSASEILRRRYATGEITREQYDEMRRTIDPTA